MAIKRYLFELAMKSARPTDRFDVCSGRGAGGGREVYLWCRNRNPWKTERMIPPLPVDTFVLSRPRLIGTEMRDLTAAEDLLEEWKARCKRSSQNGRSGRCSKRRKK